MNYPVGLGVGVISDFNVPEKQSWIFNITVCYNFTLYYIQIIRTRQIIGNAVEFSAVYHVNGHFDPHFNHNHSLQLRAESSDSPSESVLRVSLRDCWQLKTLVMADLASPARKLLKLSPLPPRSASFVATG